MTSNGCKLSGKCNCDEIEMADMVDSQLGVILTDSGYKGVVVHCHNRKIIAIGRTSGASWDAMRGNHNRVRLLKKGELIEVC